MNQDKRDFVVNTLSSASAGLIGRFICHPIDTLKAKLQVTDTRTLRDVMSSTWRTEGLSGFYRGLGAVLIGGVPGVCVYLTTYEFCKDRLNQTRVGSQNLFLVYMTSGMISEAIWWVIKLFHVFISSYKFLAVLFLFPSTLSKNDFRSNPRRTWAISTKGAGMLWGQSLPKKVTVDGIKDTLQLCSRMDLSRLFISEFSKK
jgi:hypothetical protein